MHEIGSKLRDQLPESKRCGHIQATLASDAMHLDSPLLEGRHELVLPGKDVCHPVLERGPVPDFGSVDDETLGSAQTQTFD
jgi:hypothetical protein